jgi:curved DNA-binding protein CbpA
MADYYTVLRVPKDASEEEIKRAYKALAKRWHPDKNPEKQEEATKKFKEVSEAYQVLNDPIKRRLYDREGRASLSSSCSSQGPGPRRASGSRGQSCNRPSAEQGRNTDPFDDFIFTDGNPSAKWRPRPGARSSSSRTRVLPGFSSRSSFGHAFTFKDPEALFKEFFGGRDPLSDLGSLHPRPGRRLRPDHSFFSDFSSFELPSTSRRWRRPGGLEEVESLLGSLLLGPLAAPGLLLGGRRAGRRRL